MVKKTKKTWVGILEKKTYDFFYGKKNQKNLGWNFRKKNL